MRAASSGCDASQPVPVPHPNVAVYSLALCTHPTAPRTLVVTPAPHQEGVPVSSGLHCRRAGAECGGRRR